MDAPKFIASDIDGTFLNPEHRVVPRNRDVVTRAVQAGATFALATGRPHRWIYPVLEQIPLRPVCVTSNGAVVYDSDQDRILRAIEMDRSEEHTSELQSRFDLVCRLLLEKKKTVVGNANKRKTIYMSSRTRSGTE